MKKLLFKTIFFVLLLLGLGLWVLYTDMQTQLDKPFNFATEEKLIIKPGMSLTRIGSVLVDKGWLSHPYYFVLEGRKQGRANSIQVGEYAIEPQITPRELLELLVSGKVIQYSLTLVEGWSFSQMMQAVRGNSYLLHTLPNSKPETIMQALGQPDGFPEGLFFPDTYYFPKNTTDVDFLLRAYKTMQQILKEEWQKKVDELPYNTPYQALIMASIIEKETATPEEYGTIAGVFTRRLKLRMKLQTDPTVIYALGKNYDGNIRKRDLSFDSPYNTYVYRGLPPTPIAMPGRAAIRAALNPEPGDVLYFVAKGDGSHYFSRTLEEHNLAVRKYQLKK